MLKNSFIYLNLLSADVLFNFITKGAGIWVKEKVQPLKIINALFLEPHILCYVILFKIFTV